MKNIKLFPVRNIKSSFITSIEYIYLFDIYVVTIGNKVYIYNNVNVSPGVIQSAIKNMGVGKAYNLYIKPTISSENREIKINISKRKYLYGPLILNNPTKLEKLKSLVLHIQVSNNYTFQSIVHILLHIEKNYNAYFKNNLFRIALEIQKDTELMNSAKLSTNFVIYPFANLSNNKLIK